MSKIVDGDLVPAVGLAKLKAAAQHVATGTGGVTGVSAIIDSQDPAIKVNVASKGKKARECGSHSTEQALATKTTEEEGGVGPTTIASASRAAGRQLPSKVAVDRCIALS